MVTGGIVQVLPVYQSEQSCCSSYHSSTKVSRMKCKLLLCTEKNSLQIHPDRKAENRSRNSKSRRLFKVATGCYRTHFFQIDIIQVQLIDKYGLAITFICPHIYYGVSPEYL